MKESQRSWSFPFVCDRTRGNDAACARVCMYRHQRREVVAREHARGPCRSVWRVVALDLRSHTLGPLLPVATVPSRLSYNKPQRNCNHAGKSFVTGNMAAQSSQTCGEPGKLTLFLHAAVLQSEEATLDFSRSSDRYRRLRSDSNSVGKVRNRHSHLLAIRVGEISRVEDYIDSWLVSNYSVEGVPGVRIVERRRAVHRQWRSLD